MEYIRLGRGDRLRGLSLADQDELSPSGVVTGTGLGSYRFKWGTPLATDCSDPSGYSADVPVTTDLTADLSGEPDGDLRLCLLGRRANGKSQTLVAATVVDWTKDTLAPVAVVAGAPTGTNNLTVLAATIGARACGRSTAPP